VTAPASSASATCRPSLPATLPGVRAVGPAALSARPRWQVRAVPLTTSARRGGGDADVPALCEAGSSACCRGRGEEPPLPPTLAASAGPRTHREVGTARHAGGRLLGCRAGPGVPLGWTGVNGISKTPAGVRVRVRESAPRSTETRGDAPSPRCPRGISRTNGGL